MWNDEAAMSLNSTQRKLQAEIEEIASIVRMDHWAIEKYDADMRTTYLRAMKQQLVRSEIVIQYALIDELLSVIISKFYFRRPKSEVGFRALLRTKRFRTFSQYMLDEMYPLPKMRLANEIRALPREVRQNIERINALRNAIAHSYFPENRRQYAQHKHVTYRGEDVFSAQGVASFVADANFVTDCLVHRAFGISI